MSISQNFPDEGPSLNLNFASSRILDPRITFTRTSTGTYLSNNGLVTIASANTPRFDHSYNGSNVQSLGLLIEESRTNIYLQSEAFNTSPNITTNATITANTTTSPDGLVSADKLVENASTGNKETAQSIGTITSGTYYTVSVFTKAAERNIFRIAMDTSRFGTGTNAYFNLLTGTVAGTEGGVTSASIIPYPNGWYRCTATFLPTATGSSSVYITLIQSGTTSNYTGDGTSGLFLWGAQVETGAFPTSYIPTVASTVTRSADNASMTGTNFSSWYNSSEGSVFVNYKGKSQEGTSYERIYSINLNSTPIVEEILLINNIGYNPDRIGYAVYDNSSAIQDTTGTTGGYVVASSSPVKTAMCYKTANYAYVFNGGTVITGNAAGVPTVNTLDIGRVGAGSQLNGTISQLLYYPKRLTNSQLQNLTK